MMFDMAPVIHMIKPNKAVKFGELAAFHLIPYLKSHINGNTTRIDGVWESYKRFGSIKTQTHQKRGETASRRTRITADTPIPKGKLYNKFLTDSNNKDELFQFLANKLIEKMQLEACNIITTKREYVLSTQELDTESLQPCDYGEGDTRVFLHLKHATLQGHKIFFIQTVHTDLVVIATSVFSTLKELGLTELYIRYGMGKHRRDIPIQEVCYQLGPRKCLALPLYYCNSGSDFSSFKRGIGKKTAWNAWEALPEMTEVFIEATEKPETLSLDSARLKSFQKLTCREYSKTLNVEEVNEAREILFTKSLRGLKNIPPLRMLSISMYEGLFM